MTKANFRVLSLFSGCGGMDLGFEGGFDVFPETLNERIHPEWFVNSSAEWITLPLTGFETVFANDIMPESMRAWNHFFGKRRNIAGVYRLGSIVDYVKQAINSKEIHKVFPEKVDVVTGGFPCNDFSVSGWRLGFDSHKTHTGSLRYGEPSEESRGRLYIWMKQVIEITRPKAFVAENVKGLVSLGEAKAIIENDFRGVDGGYLVVPAKVLSAQNYGVPQTRERVIFFGFRKDALAKKAIKAFSTDPICREFDPYPQQTHGVNAINGLLSHTTVRQALRGLPEPVDSPDLSHRIYSRAKFMGRHCQGQKEIALDSSGPTIRAEHHGNIEYRRLSQEHGGRIFTEIDSGLPERRLSVRECARIQTFPDDYEFIIKDAGDRKFLVNSTMAYKIVGNAVPPLLSYHIAQRLKEIWNSIFR
jgi:DNA (cytosine-5)-methyltransferase 1